MPAKNRFTSTPRRESGNTPTIIGLRPSTNPQPTILDLRASNPSGNTARRTERGFVIGASERTRREPNDELGMLLLATPALPAVTPAAIAPATPQEQSLALRRRRGLRQTLLTGGQGVVSSAVSRVTLLGS